MRVALLVKQADYSSPIKDNIDLQGIEVVDPLRTDTSVALPVDDTYTKIFLDVLETAYKTKLVANFDCFQYKKSENKLVVIQPSMPGRKLTTFDTSIPVVTDQYLVPFVIS